MMLAGRGPGDARAIDEVRGQFSRARQHEIAITAALREALAALLEKLNPECARGAARPAVARASPARDAGAALEPLSRPVPRDRAVRRRRLPAVFLTAFARAYESLAAGGSARGPGDRE